MKFFVLLFISSFCFIACGNQVSSEDQSKPKIEQDILVKNGNSLLWKIEGRGIRPSYLFGTMHRINKSFFYFPDELEKRISSANKVIMELDGIPDPVLTFKSLSLDSGVVQDYFTPKQLLLVIEFMEKELEIPRSDFDKTFGKFKPLLILQSIAQLCFEPDAMSYDLKIMEVAGENKIPILGLETIEEQLILFDQISISDYTDMIITNIKKFDKRKKESLLLMETYYKQKVKKIIPLMKKQSPELMKYADPFIYNRNEKWIPKIVTEIKNGNCFIAVGAGHLFEEKGLVSLLKKEGFILSPIQF